MPQPRDTESVGALPDLRASSFLSLGRVIADRFELQEFLGRGGTAVVYRAYDRLLKIEVALKLIHPERDSEKALARLRREIAIARAVESPHLVRIFEVGQAPDGLFVTMELLPGRSLRERLSKEPQLPIADALRIAEQVLECLNALHRRNVVHRDVTPGNILFTAAGEAKLADYGLVRRRDREESLLTEHGVVVGTVGYLSPEQTRGEEATPQSDLFALGVVLFRMLAGQLPVEASSEFEARLAPLVVAPNVQGFRLETPIWLARIVAHLLERRPADRYPNAEAVLEDLRARRGPRQPRGRRRLFHGVATALSCLMLVGGPAKELRPSEFSHLVPAGETGIKAVGKAGETLWTLPGVAPEIADRGALARIQPGGPRLLAIVLVRPRHWLPEDISTLTFLDPDSGRVVRQVKLPSGAKNFPNDPPRFIVSSVKTVDLFHDGVDEVIVNYSHVPEAPFYAVLYAPRFDQARIVYHSRGGQDFQGAVDLDGDGVQELLFAGIDNGWNWVNVVAAVRLDPRSLKEIDRVAPAAAPDVMVLPQQDRMLLWYAVIPRGLLEELSRITIDKEQRALTVHYLSGKTWTLGFNGFPLGDAGADLDERQEARRLTYEHFRESERLRQVGALDLAMAEADAAHASAMRSREAWLGQYAERLRGEVLVAEGKLQQAENLFVSLAERAEDAPEVAYDAAVAFHLEGDLRRAVAWYERGIGRESAMGAGKSKHEFLKGEVLALVEEKRYSDAFKAVDRFGATYPPNQVDLWLYRGYIQWREGERPAAASSELAPNATDLCRYWALEFDLARGGNPKEILGRADRFLAERPETRVEVQSLRAELLAQLGQLQEAGETARMALADADSGRMQSIVARGHYALLLARARRLQAQIQRAALPKR